VQKPEQENDIIVTEEPEIIMDGGSSFNQIVHEAWKNYQKTKNIEYIKIIYTKMYGLMEAYFVRRTQSLDAAKDLIHDTFIIYLLYLNKNEVTNYKSVLYKIARTPARDYFKEIKRSRKNIEFDDTVDNFEEIYKEIAIPEPEYEYEDDYTKLFKEPYREQVKKLTVKYTKEYINKHCKKENVKKYFYLIFIEGLTSAEAGRRLGMKASVIRSNKRYHFNNLRKEVDSKVLEAAKEQGLI